MVKGKKCFHRLIGLLLCLCLTVSGCGQKNTESQDSKLTEKYGNEEQIQQAVSKIENGKVKEAGIFQGVKSFVPVLGLSLEGVPEEKTLGQILKILNKYNVKATFFVQGIKTAEDPDLIRQIVNEGHEIGNYTLEAKKEMQKLDVEQLVTDFAKTSAILEEASGQEICLIRCNATEYTKEVLQAVKASGLRQVIKPSSYLSYQSLSSQKETTGYLRRVKNGGIVTVKLDSVLDATEFRKEREEERPAEDKEKGIKEEEVAGKEDDRLIKLIEMICIGAKKNGISLCGITALKGYHDSDLTQTFEKERKANKGLKATVISKVNTSKEYVSLTFRAIGEEERLNKVLKTLASYQIKATFFVTGEDILSNPKLVKKIIDAGHEIGNGGLTKETMIGKNYNQICREISKTEKLLKKKYGIQAKYFMTFDAKTNAVILEAASTFGYKVAGYNKSPIKSTSQSDAVTQNYFRQGFNTGDVVALRLDNYQNLDSVIHIIRAKASASAYKITTLGSLVKLTEVKKNLTSIPGWNRVHKNKDWKNYKYNQNRVVEKVNTKNKVVFFTFDDWGSDRTIRSLLRVLKKYNIKATFFVRGNGVDMNPNLLKAISDAGHEIGNHTYEHKIITKISKTELQNEIVKCHQAITKAIGKCPTLYFRPPTMENDEETIKAILSTGVSHILLGQSLSTHDYEKSAQGVVKLVMENLEPGGIITMHMSDNASAIQAIPILVSKLKQKGYQVGDLRNYLK